MRIQGRFGGRATVICVLAIVALFLTVPETKSQSSPEVNQLLVFFRDVLLIDTSGCTISGGPLTGSGYDNSPELGTRGICQGKVTLTFNSGGSVDSLFEFRGKNLVWCLIYYDNGNKDPIPYLRPPSGDPLEMARSFLDRYETFTNDSAIANMKQLLSEVKNVEQISKTEDQLKLVITVRDAKPDFEWSYSFEEEDYRLLSISFQTPPHIFTLGDQRYRYNISTNVLYEPMNGISEGEISIDSLISEHSRPEETVQSGASSNADYAASNLVKSGLTASALTLGLAVVLVQARTKWKGRHFRTQTSPLARPSPKRSWKKLAFEKKLLTFGFILLLLFSLQVGLKSVMVAKANFMFPPLEKIYIKSDGTVSPASTSISQSGNVYTLIGNITNYPLEIQRDNIVIEGAGFTLQKNTPAYGRQDAVAVRGRSNITINNIDIRGYDYAVYLSNSSNCVLEQNTFSNNKYGIVLADKSENNSISDNRWLSGGGIFISTSANNTLKNNYLDGSSPNFWVDNENVTSTSDFVNEIDESNTIHEKPICYWINQQNRTVPQNAGYVALINCSYITVENLTLANNGQGVLLIATKNTHVVNNNFAGNNKGIAIYNSPNNTFEANNLTNNTYGIVCRSRPNAFRANNLENNTCDANFEERFFDEFDRSNIVDGKPICYWLWQRDKTVPPDSGYVVLLSCQNITVQNLNITNRRHAMYFAELKDSLIQRNIISNNKASIILMGSQGNKIVGNFVTNNTDGVYLEASTKNEISKNKITFDSNFGIRMDDGSENLVAYNYIAHCRIGYIMNRGEGNIFSGNTLIYTTEKAMHIGESVDNMVTGNNIAWSKGWAITISGNVGNNSIHHNNFINNAICDPHQGYPGAYTQNIWDNGHEGNFWSDYQEKYPAGKENAVLGIWDTPVALNPNNTDRFPLATSVNMKYQVTILQPANASYKTSVPLAFLATAPASWMGYSLNGNANVTTRGNVFLDNLLNGTHTIIVYAGREGGTCARETVRFTVEQYANPLDKPESGTPTSDQPSASSSPSPPPLSPNLAPTPNLTSLSPSLTQAATSPTVADPATTYPAISIAVIVTVAVAAALILRKRKLSAKLFRGQVDSRLTYEAHIYRVKLPM